MKRHVNSCRLPTCGSRKSSSTLQCLTQTLPLLLRLSAGADGVTAPRASPGKYEAWPCQPPTGLCSSAGPQVTGDPSGERSALQGLPDIRGDSPPG